ncbi:NUDIX hydrolase [Acidobacterium sp. S8]|uniref:NUDIX hydrolase n=1 Tax=Acidobacterium sp. S8 TaxID=1641854 RepID=UPI00131DFF05|nr:NUDIX hydrolase [Acidobacterium sp. S8]
MPPKKKAVKSAITFKKAKFEVLSSKVAYDGPLFRVLREEVQEPGNKTVSRDIIRHNGSVVILAVLDSTKRDPLIVMERQYRHAAGQYLWEIPAGKMDEGEERLAAAKRELIEETGYRAKKWTRLVRYFASPGFLGEWMQIFLAEELTAGEAAPEEDELLEVVLVPLSEILNKIDEGKILDGKTLVAVQLYARLRAKKKLR